MALVWTSDEQTATAADERHWRLARIAQDIAKLAAEAYTVAGGVKPNIIQTAYIRKQAERLVTAQMPSAETRAKTAADRALADTLWAAVRLVREDFGRPMDPVTHSALRQVVDIVTRVGSDPIFGAYTGVLDRWGQKQDRSGHDR